MISIKTTPKLNGITIQGDFDDLNNLYEAISDYTTFYIDGILNEIESDYVKEHGVAIKDMTTEQRDTFFQLNQSEITYFEEVRENILGLCYDIRHAYQGDRGVALVENGRELIYECEGDLPSKNLQFSVEVLYPWAFYYLFAMRDMLDNMYILSRHAGDQARERRFGVLRRSAPGRHIRCAGQSRSVHAGTGSLHGVSG